MKKTIFVFSILAVALLAFSSTSPVLAAEPEAAFVWNGIGGKRGLIVAELRKRRIPVLIMERGFFDRFRHTQIDHRGFNHTSSWAARLEEPCPADGATRLAAAWGQCEPVKPRRSGHEYFPAGFSARLVLQ